MKLQDLREEVIWQGEIDGQDYDVVVLGEMQIAIKPSKGGLVQSFKDSVAQVASNPKLALASAALAVAAIAKYNSNKRNTMRLFAKDHIERKLYQKIINDLMKTGGYKKVKEKYAEGGYLWVLQRK